MARIPYPDSDAPALAERVERIRRERVGDRRLVELTETVGGCNLVSRFLEAMKIDHESPR